MGVPEYFNYCVKDTLKTKDTLEEEVVLIVGSKREPEQTATPWSRLAVFLLLLRILLSNLILIMTPKFNLCFLMQCKKCCILKHFDGYYNPVLLEKFLLYFWLLLCLASKMNIKWQEKNRLRRPHSY